MTRPQFASWLALQFEQFVTLKRATGARYESSAILLRGLDRYLQQRAHEPPLNRDVLLDYLRTLATLSPRSRDNMVSVVWSALSHARRHGADVAPLPPRPLMAPRSHRVAHPRLINADEITAIVVAARELPRADRLRPATYATLFGLLWTTGLRISEALDLDIGDVDFDASLVTVRHGKFGKTRVLPVRLSTVDAVARYVRDPRRPIGTAATAPLFVSGRKRRHSHSIVSRTLHKLCRATGC